MASEGTPRPGLGIGRRSFLVGMGAGAGLLLGRGLGTGGPLDPRDPAPSYPDTLRRLAPSLTPRQRELLVLPADHPSRQVTNTLVFLDRPHLGTLLSPGQQLRLRELCDAMLSPRGRDAFAGTLAVEGKLEGCVLAIYGEPESGRAQVAVMGGHVHLRGGGASSEGAAFGGAIAYGHQIGNEEWRVPGNSFAYHGDAANRLYAALAPAERARARVAEPPHELVLQPLPAGASFPGVGFGTLGEAARDEAARLVDTVFSCYPDAERREALACIDANGGLDALHIAYYENRGYYADMKSWGELDAAERARRGDPYWQVWRIEGPGSVVHFKGAPHVHAYIHVVRDPARANLGEALAESAAPIEGEAMRRLLEAALRSATGEALAWYGPEVPGRFCAGPITSGLAWTLDPYANRVVVATIAEPAMAEPLRARLRAAGVELAPGSRQRVATAEYFTRERELFGDPERVEAGEFLVRDALVAHLRADGIAAARG